MGKEVTFKAGDKVYCPYLSNEIFVLSKYYETEYPIQIFRIRSTSEKFKENGSMPRYDGLPNIFHATEENCKKLSKLYKVEFEDPNKPVSHKETIKRMLDGGYRGVMVSYELLDKSIMYDCITSYHGDILNGVFSTYDEEDLKPFFHLGGKPIKEFLNTIIFEEE